MRFIAVVAYYVVININIKINWTVFEQIYIQSVYIHYQAIGKND